MLSPASLHFVPANPKTLCGNAGMNWIACELVEFRTGMREHALQNWVTPIG